MANAPKLDWRGDFLQNWSAPIALAGRLGLAYIFLVDGAGAISHAADVAAYMAANGVNGGLLPLVIVTEIGGGLMVLAGFLTRWAAIALAGFCILTAALFHTGSDDIGEAIHFQKDLAIAGGLLVLAAFGPGAWSLDAWRGRPGER